MIINVRNVWLNQYSRRRKSIEVGLLISVVLSFTLSDWMIGLFTFTEYILGTLIIVAFLTGKFRLYIHQIKWISILVGVIVLHSILIELTGQEINYRVIVIGIIKLLFYLINITWITNLIKDLNLKSFFLLIVNSMAVVILLLGVYIATAVYLEVNTEIELPYAFLLRFTRLDGHLFRRDIPIVRMKSIFEEPAHLGYYLNSILSVNVFGTFRLDKGRMFNLFLIVGILMTMSYSAIVITMTILLIKLVYKILKKDIAFSVNYKVIFPALIIVIIVFIFRDVLFTTFIRRTMELLDGTETSGYERLFDSWRYITRENLLLGVGFMHSQGYLWNNYAYAITEMGVIGLAIIGGFNLFLLKSNIGLGLVFLLLNFAKGGYLSSSYWFLILLILIYFKSSPGDSYTRKEEYFEIKRRL